MSKNFEEVIFTAAHPSVGGRVSFALSNSAWAKIATLVVTIALDSTVGGHRGFTWSVLDASGNVVYTQPLEGPANWTPSSPPPQPILISEQNGAGGFGTQFQAIPNVFVPPNGSIVFDETSGNIDTSDTVALVGVLEF